MLAREVHSAPFVALGGPPDYRYFEVPSANFADYDRGGKLYHRIGTDGTVVFGLEADDPAILFGGLALDVPALHNSFLVVFFDNQGRVIQTTAETYSMRTLACPLTRSEEVLKLYFHAGTVFMTSDGFSWIEWNWALSWSAQPYSSSPHGEPVFF